MLYLEGNKLDEIPEELFTNLKSLQWLDVRNNQIKFLPLTIKGHLNLETILIQRNKLEKLPIELGNKYLFSFIMIEKLFSCLKH